MIKHSSFLIAALFVAILMQPRLASAQIVAADDAAAYVNWVGESHGFGFQPWVLSQTGTGNGNFTGFYIGNPGNIGSTNGHAFGMYANGSSGVNAATAFRGFTNSLATNEVFKIQWETYGIGFSGGNRGGFFLRNGNATNSPSDSSTSARFGFYFFGGGLNSFAIEDGFGISYIGIPFTSAGLSCEFTPHSDDTYRFVVKDAVSANILYAADGQPLEGIFGGTIDSVACFAQQTGGDQVFNNLAIASTSLVPPLIDNIQPADGSIFLDPSTTNVTFEVDSAFSTVSSNGTTLLLNGIAQQLVFNTSGNTTQLLATNISALAPDTLYKAAIIALDSNGNRITNTFTFNTWITNLFFVEAEDYNFGSGDFLNNLIFTGYDLYAGLNGTNFVDYFKPSPGDGGTNTYRPGDLVDLDAPPISADVDHNGFAANGATDYNLSFVNFGEWENYTRVLATNDITYNVYARMASLSANPTMELDRIAATGNVAATNQPLAALGTCVCPANTGGSQSYTFVPLADFFSNPVLVHLTGTNTLRSTRIGGSYNLNYFVFVPSTNTATLKPYISSGFPFPAASAAPETIISFTIANRQTAVNPATIQLLLNSSNVTPSITVSNNAAGCVVTYVPSQLFPPNTTNTLTAIFTDNGGTPVTITNTWTFTVLNVSILTLPAADAQPSNAGSNPGFAIHIAKAPDSSPDSDFPTTLARAEAQLANRITNANTGLPYPNLATNASGTNFYADSGVINFDIDAQSTGTFPGDTAFPYIPASGTNDLIAMEAEMYVQLTNGTYVFFVRSDDGFQLTCGPTPGNTNFVIGLFDAGRDNSTPTTMYFNVATNGLYPMRLLYFQGRFGGSVEFYALNRSQKNQPILINDPGNPNSIKTFQTLAISGPVTLLNPAHQGNTTTFRFVTQSGHTHFVEYKTALPNATWTPLVTIVGDGSTTNVTDSTATDRSRFYRVRTQ